MCVCLYLPWSLNCTFQPLTDVNGLSFAGPLGRAQGSSNLFLPGMKRLTSSIHKPSVKIPFLSSAEPCFIYLFSTCLQSSCGYEWAVVLWGCWCWFRVAELPAGQTQLTESSLPAVHLCRYCVRSHPVDAEAVDFCSELKHTYSLQLYGKKYQLGPWPAPSHPCSWRFDAGLLSGRRNHSTICWDCSSLPQQEGPGVISMANTG